MKKRVRRINRTTAIGVGPAQRKSKVKAALSRRAGIRGQRNVGRLARMGCSFPGCKAAGSARENERLLILKKTSKSYVLFRWRRTVHEQE
jgi:hypothetical protein